MTTKRRGITQQTLFKMSELKQKSMQVFRNVFVTFQVNLNFVSPKSNRFGCRVVFPNIVCSSFHSLNKSRVCVSVYRRVLFLNRDVIDGSSRRSAFCSVKCQEVGTSRVSGENVPSEEGNVPSEEGTCSR